MDTTSVSLIARLHRSDDHQAWEQFVRLYGPMLDFWVRKIGVPRDDAVDLVQEVFSLLIQKLPDFQYDARRRFRGWLYTVTTNRCRDWMRRNANNLHDLPDGVLETLEAGQPDCLFEDQEFRSRLAARALELMKAEFDEKQWKACWASAVEQRPAAQIASELRISVNGVYLAKSRILRRLREELADQLEEK
jgi:RNA polymerase sigma-70 factor (ECF subfamily)